MKEAVISLEADLENLRKIDFSGLNPVVVLLARILLVIEEHCFAPEAGSSKGSFIRRSHERTMSM